MQQLPDVVVAVVLARRAHLHPLGAPRAIGDGKRGLHVPESRDRGSDLHRNNSFEILLSTCKATSFSTTRARCVPSRIPPGWRCSSSSPTARRRRPRQDEAVGISASAASYHLRALAKWGLVADADGGRGRERPVAGGCPASRSSPPTTTAPRATAAVSLLVAQLVERGNRETTRFLEAESRLPAPWRRASRISNTTLQVTAAEAVEIGHRLDELLSAVPPQRARRPACRRASRCVCSCGSSRGIPNACDRSNAARRVARRQRDLDHRQPAHAARDPVVRPPDDGKRPTDRARRVLLAAAVRALVGTRRRRRRPARLPAGEHRRPTSRAAATVLAIPVLYQTIGLPLARAAGARLRRRAARRARADRAGGDPPRSRRARGDDARARDEPLRRCLARGEHARSAARRCADRGARPRRRPRLRCGDVRRLGAADARASSQPPARHRRPPASRISPSSARGSASSGGRRSCARSSSWCCITNMLDAGMGGVLMPVYADSVLDSVVALGLMSGSMSADGAPRRRCSSPGSASGCRASPTLVSVSRSVGRHGSSSSRRGRGSARRSSGSRSPGSGSGR